MPLGVRPPAGKAHLPPSRLVKWSRTTVRVIWSDDSPSSRDHCQQLRGTTVSEETQPWTASAGRRHRRHAARSSATAPLSYLVSRVQLKCKALFQTIWLGVLDLGNHCVSKKSILEREIQHTGITQVDRAKNDGLNKWFLQVKSKQIRFWFKR